MFHGARASCMCCEALTARPAEVGYPRADVAHCVRSRRCVGALGGTVREEAGNGECGCDVVCDKQMVPLGCDIAVVPCCLTGRPIRAKRFRHGLCRPLPCFVHLRSTGIIHTTYSTTPMALYIVAHDSSHASNFIREKTTYDTSRLMIKECGFSCNLVSDVKQEKEI